MGVADTIEALLQLGVSAKDAFTKAQSNKTATDWVTFLGSAEFAGIEDDVTGLVGKLTQGDLDAALTAVRQKETALLASAPSVAQLPNDKLLQYSDLLHTESLLVNRKVASVTATAEALSWVVNEALPTLLTAAKMILPLLL
jgi:hypothetical protein